ncbi:MULTISPECIES: hypothetical protein [Chryseobacterium]|uniref:Uncharacterized protein n=1 Tax=Candidatus Chryseobacterium massiliense TaxID=204089 RepID=A0A3D9B2M1_9FLAO|nr:MULTISPECIES: hypothetical protein [Chryseobacterium]REC47871.1 hypothetical protein DRF68_12580 [Candidatus Chryseobacterium massiliae]
MKNTKSLVELISIAATAFQEEKNKGVNVVYASEDGFVFIEENRARLHCKSIPDLKYYDITRTQALQTADSEGKYSIFYKTEVEQTDDQNQKSEEEKELEQLKTQYEELYGKAAHHNIGIEKLKTLISEKTGNKGSEDQGSEDQGSEDKSSEGGDNTQQS